MAFLLLQKLGIALLLSSLIGIERERMYQAGGYNSFAGLRTLTLIGVLGALAYFIGEKFYFPFFAVITAGFLALVIAGYVVTSSVDKSAGATSEIASILVYIVGILSAMGEFLIATTITLAILLTLQFRDPLHKLAKNISQKELFSTVEFIIIAFVVLPILPNQYFGPYDFFNPYVVWLMIVFISGISFLSYIAIKIFGQKGIALTGFLAGFISSTALTFSFSAQSKKNKKVVNPYVLAILIASSAMFFRVLLEILVLNRQLFSELALPFLTMGFTGFLIALYYWFKKEKVQKVVDQNINLGSPFRLKPALKFGLFFALILFLIEFTLSNFGNGGVYLTSFFSGLVDVDAITVSVANLAKNELSEDVAVVALTIAAITNTMAKGCIFLLFGERKIALKILSSFLIIVIVGLGSLFFI